MTHLAKITYCAGGDPLNEIVIRSYKGDEWRVQRGLLTDQEIESMKQNWTFIAFDKAIKKFVECDQTVAQQLVNEHAQRMLNQLREKLDAQK